MSFEKEKMVLRKEYYESTGIKPEENIGAYADFLEKRIYSMSTVSVNKMLEDFHEWQKEKWDEIYLMSNEFMVTTYLNTL